MAVTTLCTRFPSDVATKEPELLALYGKVEGLKSHQKPKAKQLIECARISIGITEGKLMARIEIAMLIQRYLQVEKEIQELEAQLITLVQTSVEYEWLQNLSPVLEIRPLLINF